MNRIHPSEDLRRIPPLALLVLLVLAPQIADCETATARNARINQEILRVARQRDTAIPPELLFSVFWQESRYNPTAQSKTTTACGLAQITAGTANRLGLRDCHDIAGSVRASARLLATAAAHFRSAQFRGEDTYRLAVAAYHAGQKCIDIAFNGQACSIVELDRQACLDARKQGKTCVSIVTVTCNAASWFNCIPTQTQTYVRSVYDTLVPLARLFMAWRKAQQDLDDAKGAVDGVSKDIESLVNRASGSKAEAVDLQFKRQQLVDARDLVTRNTRILQNANAAFEQKFKEIEFQFSHVEADYKQVRGEEESDPSGFLLERDSRPPDEDDGPCTVWTLYVNDDSIVEYRRSGVITRRALPSKWARFVKQQKHGGFVTLQFSIGQDLRATSITTERHVGVLYDAVAQDLLTGFRFPGVTPEEFIIPDEFQFTGCAAPSDRRAVSFIFGRPDDVRVKDELIGNPSTTEWSAISKGIGSPESIDDVALDYEFFDDDEPSRESLTTVYISRQKDIPGHPHVCRMETHATGETVVTVIRNHDVFQRKSGVVTHSFNPEGPDDCVFRTLQNKFVFADQYIYVGQCSFGPDSERTSKYECFVALPASMDPIALIAVNPESKFPEIAFEGSNQELAETFSDVREVEGVKLPFSIKYWFEKDDSEYEWKTLSVRLSPIPPTMFDLGKVDEELGVSETPLVLGWR